MNILTRDQRIRIFISSTIGELADERKVTIKTLSSMEHAPIYFEHGATPHNPQEVYRTYLKQSHIYVGILWEKYGYIDPTIGISGTEDEYNLATELALPKFIYLKKTKSIRDTRLQALIDRIMKDKDCVFKEFTSQKDLRNIIKKDITHFITEEFLSSSSAYAKTIPDYNKAAIKRVYKFPAIKREKITHEIKTILKTTDKVLLVGDPGIGKTFCLIRFLEKERNCFFLDLKDTQPQQALSFLANKLRQINGQSISLITNENSALLVIETESQRLKSIVTFCIDGIEENFDLAKKIFSVSLENIRFICSARKALLLDWPKINVPRLTDKEIKDLLGKWKKKLSGKELSDLIEASEGNPLYLYFFIKFNIHPLPKGLAAYQEALWASLEPIQKELLRLITLAILPIHTKNLSAALTKESGKRIGIENTQHLINSTKPLVTQINGWLTIFHRYFEEFVTEITEKEGLTTHYHELLGNSYDPKNSSLARVYHLVMSGDKSIRPLESFISKAYLSGLNKVAFSLLRANIAWAKEEGDKETEAVSSYYMADILFEMGDPQGAITKSAEALTLFAELKDKAMICFTETQTLIFQLGYEDAYKISQSIIKIIENNKIYLSQQSLGVLTINLSLALKQAGRYYDGATEAKKAYNLFSEIGDIRGIMTALVNLNACIGQFGQQAAPLQKAYAQQLIAEAQKSGWSRLELAGLNHLTQALRKLKEYPEAKKTAQKTVELSRKLHDTRREIMNLCNWGNVLKDEKNVGKALELYEEAVVKARQINDQIELGHALEMTAGCFRGKKLPLAIKRIEEAIEIQTRLANYFRLGECYCEYGEIMEAKKEKKAAADKYQQAAFSYQKAGYIDKMVLNGRYSARLYIESGDKVSAIKLLQSIFQQTRENRPDQAGRVLDILDEHDDSRDYCSEYESLMKDSLNKADTYDFTLSVVSFAVAISKKGTRLAHESYNKFLFEMAKCSNSRKTILNALSIGIDQAPNGSLSNKDLELLIHEIVLAEEHFYYSRDESSSLFTVAINDDNQPYFIEIECYSDFLVDRKAALSIALLVLGNQKYLKANILKKGGFKELAHKIVILPFEDFSKKVSPGVEVPDKTMPVVCTSSNVPFNEEQPPTLIVLHPEYENLTKDALFPGNKSFVWLTMNLYRILACHFAHLKITKEISRESRLLCEDIYARGSYEDNEGYNLSSFILPDLAEKIQSIKKAKPQ